MLHVDVLVLHPFPVVFVQLLSLACLPYEALYPLEPLPHRIPGGLGPVPVAIFTHPPHHHTPAPHRNQTWHTSTRPIVIYSNYSMSPFPFNLRTRLAPTLDPSK
jgi:hypothetical protein